MSWWDDGREVLGDRPADALKAAWRRALAERARRSQPLPTLAEALAAYASALREAGTSPRFERLSLQRPARPELSFDGNADADIDADLRAAFARELAAIDAAYREALERAPTPMELAKTMEFVVGPAPATYFQDSTDAADWTSWRLVAEPRAADGSARP